MKPFPLELTQYAKKKKHISLKDSYEILLGCKELENKVRKLSSLKRNSRKRKRSRTVTISSSSSVCSIARNPPSIMSKDNPKKYCPISRNKDRKKKFDRSRSPKNTDREETKSEDRSGIARNSVPQKSPILRAEKIEKRRRREKDEIWTVKSARTQEHGAGVTKLGTSVHGVSSLQEEKTKEMVHKTLAAKWSLILRDGLLDEIRNDLSSEYSVVPGYEYLEAPGLNTDLKAILSEKRIKADQRECSLQNQLSFALVAIEKILASLLSSNEESRLTAQTVDTLIDVGLILADAHHSFSVKRRTNVIPAFEIGDIADLSCVEASLFGERFLNILKSAPLVIEGEESGIKAERDRKTKSLETSAEKPLVDSKDRKNETMECEKDLGRKSNREADTEGKKVTNDEKNIINGGKRVIDDEKTIANGEKKVTNDGKKVTNGEKKVINDETTVANGEKKVTNDEKKVTNGEKKVTYVETKVANDEKKGTNNEKNTQRTANNDFKNSEGQSEKSVEKPKKLDNDIAKNSGDKGKVVVNGQENATKKDKTSAKTKDDTMGTEVERNNAKESCNGKTRNDTKDSLDKDLSEKVKDPPEKNKVPAGRDSNRAEKSKDPTDKDKEPGAKNNDGNKNTDIKNACPVPKTCSNVVEKIPKESQPEEKKEEKFKPKHETAEDLLVNLKNVSLRIINEITAVYQKRIDALQPEDKKIKPEIKVAKESAEVKPFPGIREALRGAYVAQGYSGVAAETMLYSLAPSTMKGYERPVRFWWDFCAKNKIDVHQGTVRDVIQFFVDHENVISSHNVLATWRSALGEFTLEDLGKSKSIANYVKGFTCVRAGKNETKCQTKNYF